MPTKRETEKFDLPLVYLPLSDTSRACYGPAWPQTQPVVDAVHADTPETLYAARLMQTQFPLVIPLCMYVVPPAATVLTAVPLLTAMPE